MTDFIDTFDRLYLPKLGIRAPTFRAVVREALSRTVRHIVETGCIRKEDNWAGDGQSTIIWSDYVQHVPGVYGTLVSIDIDEVAVELARKICPVTPFLIGDSAAELAKFSTDIDLLYLDSFDLDEKNPGPAAMHCLFELCSARPRLKKGAIVFVDDSPYNDGRINGKGMYVAEYFKHLGIHPFTMGYQVAWIMP